MKIEELKITSSIVDIINDIFQNCLPNINITSNESPNNASLKYDAVNGEYIISIGDCDNNTFERNLLHELIHVWQIENGFKQLYIKNAKYEKYQELCNMVNSFILDLNVHYKLSQYNIFNNGKYLTKYKRIQKDIRIISSIPEIKSIFTNEDCVSFALQCADIYFHLSKKKGKDLMRLSTAISSEIPHIANSFIRAIDLFDCKTSDGINSIFENLIQNISFLNQILSL